MQVTLKKNFFDITKVPVIVSLLLTTCLSCKDFVEVDIPETDIFAEAVFQSDATATSALLHLYTEMNTTSDFSGGGNSGISLLQGLSADELEVFSGAVSTRLEPFYFNNLISTDNEVTNIWNTCYSIIFGANAIIEGLTNSNQISDEVHALIEGEAKFIRAFCFFYLVNLFGDVPYTSTTDYRVNASVSRMPSLEVYQHLINDLLEAKDLLSSSYPTEGRVRPNREAATALLSRVYLYTNDWVNAEIQATEIINNTSLYSLEELDAVFLSNSNEAIWQLFPEENNNNGNDGTTFIVVDAPRFAVLNEDLLNSFEDGDERKDKWVGVVNSSLATYIFPFKYKSQIDEPESEYSIVFRLAEQYLIRAEARAQQNKLIEAISDLDTIRKRTGLPLISTVNPSISQSELLLAIEHERRIELFTEWGHRWFDLRRNGRSDEVLNTKSGWESTDILLPLPQNELDLNQNLTQNLGY